MQKNTTKLNEIEEITKLDIRSWQAHSEAQFQMSNKTNYAKYYKRFNDLKIKVEMRLFALPLSVGRLSASFLSEAAKYHDLAEEYTGSASVDNWKNVQLYLQFRYLVINIFKNAEKPLEMSDLITISNQEGFLEKEQWRFHHAKQYNKFVEVSKKLYNLIGLSNSEAEKAANFLKEACEYHDKAEKESGLFDKYQKEGYLKLYKHYQVLLTKRQS